MRLVPDEVRSAGARAASACRDRGEGQADRGAGGAGRGRAGAGAQAGTAGRGAGTPPVDGQQRFRDPSSKEGIGAKAARKAREKKGRQEPERERSKDRKRGGQPGHQGKGLKRDPGPDDTQTGGPPAECRSCHGSLEGAGTVEPRWAQVIGIEVLRKVTEVLLPGLACGGCGTVTYAAVPPGFHPGSVSYGPVLNGAAVLLSCFGNVPAERSARLIGMLTGQDASSGWVGKAVARLDAGLRAVIRCESRAE